MAALGVLFVIVGAVLKFAVKTAVKDVNLGTIGVILMLGGALALLVALVRGMGVMGFRSRSERHVSSDGRHVVEETSQGL